MSNYDYSGTAAQCFLDSALTEHAICCLLPLRYTRLICKLLQSWSF